MTPSTAEVPSADHYLRRLFKTDVVDCSHTAHPHMTRSHVPSTIGQQIIVRKNGFRIRASAPQSEARLLETCGHGRSMPHIPVFESWPLPRLAVMNVKRSSNWPHMVCPASQLRTIFRRGLGPILVDGWPPAACKFPDLPPPAITRSICPVLRELEHPSAITATHEQNRARCCWT